MSLSTHPDESFIHHVLIDYGVGAMSWEYECYLCRKFRRAVGEAHAWQQVAVHVADHIEKAGWRAC